MIRHATVNDIPAIKAIADSLRDQISFVRTGQLEQGISNSELYVAEIDNQVVGFINWHRRRDGLSKVSELAVTPKFRCKGVGRNLLYALPCPIMLKVTVDNPANEFYAKAGMRCVSTEQGKQRWLNVYEMNILNIVVRGNNPRVPEICRKSGSAYGVKQGHKAHEQVFMLDVEFKNPDWMAYLEQVRQLQPIQALVVDYEDPAKKDEMLSQVDELKKAGVLRVVVCVKFHGATADIPKDCIIGVSLRTEGRLANGNNPYAGFMPDFRELSGRKCHLLGGSPQLQKDTITKLLGHGASVISADGNAHFGAGSKGSTYYDNTWNRKPGEKANWYESALISSKAIQRELNAIKFQQLSLFG